MQLHIHGIYDPETEIVHVSSHNILDRELHNLRKGEKILAWTYEFLRKECMHSPTGEYDTYVDVSQEKYRWYTGTQ